jgi:hypothetical protein
VDVAPNLASSRNSAASRRFHLDTSGWDKDTARRRLGRGRALCCNAQCNTSMTYIRDLERELKALLQEGDEAAIIRFVKEKALESYRNGLNAVALRVDSAAQKLERSVRA